MKSKTVILSVGRPGAGKTTSSDLEVARGRAQGAVHVEDWFIIHDEHWYDAYNNHYLKEDTWKNLWGHVRDLLHQYKGTLIVDMWLPTPQRRAEVAAAMRSLGVEKVICWHFVTPPETCRRRYIDRQAKFCPEGLFHNDRYGLGLHWDSLNRQYLPVGEEEVGQASELTAGFDQLVTMNCQ